jgi:hypothetical protein
MYLPFTYYDYYGSQVGGSTRLSQALGMVNLGYEFKDIRISTGANLKVLYNNVPTDILEARYGSDYTDQNYLLYAGDVGIFGRADILKTYIGPEPSFMYGLVVKNFGYSADIEKLPTEVQAGVSYRLFWHLLLTGQLNVPLYEPIYGAAGLEFDIRKRIFLQAGVRISENPMLGVGFGYRFRDIELHASYTPRLEFPNIFSVSINFYFGETKTRRRDEQITSLMIQSLEQFEAHHYDEALQSTEMILELDPQNKIALSLQSSIVKIQSVNGDE